MCNSVLTYYMSLTRCRQRAQTAELLLRHLSHKPSAHQLTGNQVPLRLDDRLQAARDLIETELEDMAKLRREMNQMSDALLAHILVLRNVRDNFLRW